MQIAVEWAMIVAAFGLVVMLVGLVIGNPESFFGGVAISVLSLLVALVLAFIMAVAS